MPSLTTHALDTMHGCPAAGMAVALYRVNNAGAVLLKTITLNADGRCDAPLLAGGDFVPGRYRLLFQVAAYFRAKGVALAEPAFLDAVPVDFGIADRAVHHHVPLLVSPYGYTSYRGS